MGVRVPPPALIKPQVSGLRAGVYSRGNPGLLTVLLTSGYGGREDVADVSGVLLQDMGFAGVATTHGFRATFRTWASETTAFDKDVIETCLAHAQGELDSAYHRGSFLAKRRLLMAAWADYCGDGTMMQGAEVLELRR